MSSSADMTIWLREQIEADRYRAYHERGCPAHPDQWIDGPFGPCECDSRHVATDCDAKLAILDEHYGFLNPHGNPDRACRRCSDRRADDDPMVHDDRWIRLEPAPCLTVRLLARGYQHRRGYREEWRA